MQGKAFDVRKRETRTGDDDTGDDDTGPTYEVVCVPQSSLQLNEEQEQLRKVRIAERITRLLPLASLKKCLVAAIQVVSPDGKKTRMQHLSELYAIIKETFGRIGLKLPLTVLVPVAIALVSVVLYRMFGKVPKEVLRATKASTGKAGVMESLFNYMQKAFGSLPPESIEVRAEALTAVVQKSTSIFDVDISPVNNSSWVREIADEPLVLTMVIVLLAAPFMGKNAEQAVAKIMQRVVGLATSVKDASGRLMDVFAQLMNQVRDLVTNGAKTAALNLLTTARHNLMAFLQGVLGYFYQGVQDVFTELKSKLDDIFNRM